MVGYQKKEKCPGKKVKAGLILPLICIYKYMMTFKQFFYEMASFSLPRKIELFGKDYSAIDMKFEIPPKTLDRNGMVMNQGSKFFARIPHTDKYIVYDGAGYTQFSSPNKEDILLRLGYERVPDDWYKKADFID